MSATSILPISDRISTLLRNIEDAFRSRSLDSHNANSMLTANLFSIGTNLGAHKEELQLLHGLLTYFTSQKQEEMRIQMFLLLFNHAIDARKLQVLSKIASLVVSLSIVEFQELLAFWIKFQSAEIAANQNATILRCFMENLVSDVISVDTQAHNLFASISKGSFTFAEAFLYGLTRVFHFVDPASSSPTLSNQSKLRACPPSTAAVTPPPPVVLDNLLQWMRQYKELILNNDWANQQVLLRMPSNKQSSSASANFAPQYAIHGVICWLITEPLCVRFPDTCSLSNHNSPTNNTNQQEEDDTRLFTSGIQFELLQYLSSARPNACIPFRRTLFNRDFLVELVTFIQSAQNSSNSACVSAACIDFSLRRLSEILLMAHIYKWSTIPKESLCDILKPFWSNTFVSVLRHKINAE